MSDIQSQAAGTPVEGSIRVSGPQPEPAGLYAKFEVRRTDPAAQERHKDCPMIVLDVEHDVHARWAALEYALSCEKDFPQLAADITRLVTRVQAEHGVRRVEESR